MRSDLNDIVQAKIIDNTTEQISPGDLRDVLAEFTAEQMNIDDDFQLCGLRAMTARPYKVGESFTFNGVIYEVVTAHTAGTTPDMTKVVKVIETVAGGIVDWVAGPVEQGKVYNYNGVIIRRDGADFTSANPATESGWKFLQNEMATASVVSSILTFDCKKSNDTSFFASFNTNNNTLVISNCPEGGKVAVTINNASTTDKTLKLDANYFWGDSNNRVVITEILLIPGINTFLFIRNKNVIIPSFAVFGTKIIAQNTANNEAYNLTTWQGDTEDAPTRSALSLKFEDDKTFYLNEIAQVREGLAPKTPVDVTVETDLDLNSTHTILQGVSINLGSRVALVGQSLSSENGIYVADISGNLTRADDMNAAAEFLRAYFYTEAGTNAGKRYVVTQAPAIVDTDDVIIIYQNANVIPNATETVVGAVELADSSEVDATIALSTEPSTATNKVLNLKQLWRFLEYLKTLFYTKLQIEANYVDLLFDKTVKFADNGGSGNNFAIGGYTELPYMFLISFSPTIAGYRPSGASTLTIAGQTLPLTRQGGASLQLGDVTGGLYLCLRSPFTDAYHLVGVGIAGSGGGGGGGTWGSITGTLSDQADLQTALTVAETNAKAYADSLVVGLLDDRGNYNPSTNSNQYPTTGGSGTAAAIKKGDLWTINGLGTGISVAIGGAFVSDGDVVRALVDAPAQTDANWVITENNIGYVPENANNKTSTILGNETSTSLYATIKGIVDYFTGARIKTLLGISTLTGSNTGDQVFEYANLAAFPATGVASTIYIAIDTGLMCRWSGSTYVAVGGGSLPSTVGNRFIINKTASWSITQTEVNSTISGGYSGITYVYNSTTAGTFTVPFLTVPLGFTIRVHVINTGMVTVVANFTTVNSRDNLLKSVAQHSAFELEYINTNVYQLAGDLV